MIISRSESMVRGAGCVNRARPDLWEPRAGNRPGPPDFSALRCSGLLTAGSRGRGRRNGFDSQNGVVLKRGHRSADFADCADCGGQACGKGLARVGRDGGQSAPGWAGAGCRGRKLLLRNGVASGMFAPSWQGLELSLASARGGFANGNRAGPATYRTRGALGFSGVRSERLARRMKDAGPDKSGPGQVPPGGRRRADEEVNGHEGRDSGHGRRPRGRLYSWLTSCPGPGRGSGA